jgi:hypothetical protein
MRAALGCVALCLWAAPASAAVTEVRFGSAPVGTRIRFMAR